MINWAVRLKNKNFWLSFVPAALLLAQAAGALFGFELELEGTLGQAAGLGKRALCRAGSAGYSHGPYD